MIKLSEEIKEAITAEFDQWKEIMYCGQDRKERMKRGAFYTPPSLIIRMLEKLESLEGTICDPCLGAGGLIAAAIIAGADPKKCYGIELDPATHALAIERLSKLGVPSENIILGSCFDEACWEKIKDDNNN